ncbi:hypothetical protein HELRODRAFT_178730 [Helobdella robusta]|uniref:Dynein assembly factor 1, axonemal homolog n=1 Tax=Helobdella robusta TaxID=6412 RepID=T1FDN0_HELRO|nr:hypothetical protein HELRODRAFT_178730 [Helobdella robusta]ESN96930.1 hypothetical protein HELRODRAFT_178730 [Helobdella robusta]
MTKLDLIQFYGDILKKISKLIILDPARKLYYLDLESKLKIEKCLKEKKTSMRSVDLSNLALTILSHADEMFWFKSINLSNNNLTELSNGHYLYCIELLILNNNRIKSCDKLYNLKQLAILDLSNNCISCVDDLRTLSSCPKLQTLFLKNNPISLIPDYENLVKNILPQVKFFN